jgi:type I restriction enzyme S subunit
VDQGVSFIRSQNVYDSSFVWDGLVRIADQEAARLTGVTVYQDDVLLNITGASILRTCVVDPEVLPARVNQHVSIVRARKGIPPRYVHNHLLLSSTKTYLLGMDAGASRQAVTKGHIESVPILEPTPAILAAWQDVVGPLYAQSALLPRNNRALVSIRDALLPLLLSGELSVAGAEQAMGASG